MLLHSDVQMLSIILFRLDKGVLHHAQKDGWALLWDDVPGNLLSETMAKK